MRRILVLLPLLAVTGCFSKPPQEYKLTPPTQSTPPSPDSSPPTTVTATPQSDPTRSEVFASPHPGAPDQQAPAVEAISNGERVVKLLKDIRGQVEKVKDKTADTNTATKKAELDAVAVVVALQSMVAEVRTGTDDMIRACKDLLHAFTSTESDYRTAAANFRAEASRCENTALAQPLYDLAEAMERAADDVPRRKVTARLFLDHLTQDAVFLAEADRSLAKVASGLRILSAGDLPKTQLEIRQAVQEKLGKFLDTLEHFLSVIRSRDLGTMKQSPKAIPEPESSVRPESKSRPEPEELPSAPKEKEHMEISVPRPEPEPRQETEVKSEVKPQLITQPVAPQYYLCGKCSKLHPVAADGSIPAGAQVAVVGWRNER